MDKKHFNYKRELKALFAEQSSQFGAGGAGRDNVNAREDRMATMNNQMEHEMEGASKKQKRHIAKMYKIH